MATNNNSQPDAERAARKEQNKQDWKDYGAAVNALNSSIEDVKGSVRSAANAAGSVGGEVGKLIGQTAIKSGAGAVSYPTASIVKKAAKNIIEFPVFVSSSVPIDFATATNSLLEQVYASFVQMVISSNPVVSAADMRSGNPFRSLKTDVTRYLEYTDPSSMIYAHEACHNVITTDECVAEFDMITLDDKMNRIVLEALDYQPLSEFDHYFMEAQAQTWDEYKEGSNKSDQAKEERDRMIAHDAMDTRVQSVRDDLAEAEARRDKIKENIESRKIKLQDQRDGIEKEMKDFKSSASSIGSSTNVNKDDKVYYDRMKQYEDRLDKIDAEMEDLNDDKRLKDANQRVDSLRKDLQKLKFDYHGEVRAKHKEDRERIETEITKKKFEASERRENAREAREEVKHKADLKAKAPQFMDETKIQKLNSMKPLMMTVGLRVMDDKNAISDVIDYVVGVKTHCRIVPADVLPDFAEYPTKTMNSVARKAKWRAGELKLFDYLFSRKEKKQAAYDSRDPRRKWYHRLYNLAHAKGSSKIARQITGTRNPDGLIPNVTMILTKSDVDMIEATNGIDLLKASTAAKICRELFLISMIVIDTDAQSIKILLPDISSDYEVHSLASVNKQLATLDTSNSVSREVSRMMRDR